MLDPIFAYRWFDGVPPGDLQQLAAAGVQRSYASNAALYCAGEQPRGVYGVLGGNFKIALSNREGQEATVTVIGAGGWLGEAALFEGAPYLANCTALRASQVLFLPRESFLAFCDRWPVIYRNLLQDASVKLKQACWMSLQNKLQSPEVRLAYRLQLLPELLAAEPGQEWISLTDRLSHELLAQMLGLSRPRLSQAMKVLELDGIVKGGHGHQSINRVRLAQYCKQAENG
ncbi:Crp/Fnr family transcriptional regulator [Pseudomonas sp. N040]|uniref:Crp/Fnr family transcriptional regulator n=1 Tax=Pseudomonas sp. N040 TaxID=2785325 RepID=UPI0018A309BD|nr:Crp/Fnr family transcriptional regulator [Pseudomonas sp. N040]MBF7731683.1 Crp/Fnr family transcriptional regulator [Pseudomonas sp. N040]MBW7015327.1 Crp/Fnr family transcriptional regulator [Pseudomonas sp. N040]